MFLGGKGALGVIAMVLVKLAMAQSHGGLSQISASKAGSDLDDPTSTDLLPNDSSNPFFEPPNSNHPSVPDQIKLTMWGHTSMLVSWVAGLPQIGDPGDLKSLDPQRYAGIVRYGMNQTSLSSEVNGSEHNLVYEMKYTVKSKTIKYLSGIQHHVVIKDLIPGRQYFYQVGDSNYANGLSPVMSFRQPKGNFPFRISAWGDSGLTKQSLGTFRDIKKRMDAAAASRPAKSGSNATGVWPDLMINVGDLSYADKWTAAGKEGKGSSFQPRWDQFSRMIQSLFSTAIPMISNNGNHEIEPLADGSSGPTFTAYNARFPNPLPGHGSLNVSKRTRPSNGYSASTTSPHSNAYGGVHLPGVGTIVTLSGYYPFEDGTDQYAFFLSTVKNLDRENHPWLIVTIHAPFYLTLKGNFKINECMRQIYEPLFKQYGVDLVLQGHSHAYERSFPVVGVGGCHSGERIHPQERSFPVSNFERQDCGVVYFLIGNAGIDDSFKVIDTSPQPDWCGPDGSSQRSAWKANKDSQIYYPNNEVCFSYQNGSFCPVAGVQPGYSAFRSVALGSGVLTLLNATNAQWDFYSIDSKEVFDSVAFAREPQCRPKRTVPKKSKSG